MAQGDERMAIEAAALAAAVFGATALLIASCLGRERAQRSSPPPERAYVETTAASPAPAAAPSPIVVPPGETAPASTTSLMSADADVSWVAPLSGMAAHSTYDPELNPVTPNAYGAPRPPPQVPRQSPPDAGTSAGDTSGAGQLTDDGATPP